jgi:predicted DNA-binding protein
VSPSPKKRGRKKVLLEPSRMYSLMMPVDLLERLKLKAEAASLTMPDVVRGAVEVALLNDPDAFDVQIEATSFQAGYKRGIRDAAAAVRAMPELGWSTPDGKRLADLAYSRIVKIAGGE